MWTPTPIFVAMLDMQMSQNEIISFNKPVDTHMEKWAPCNNNCCLYIIYKKLDTV